MPENEYEYKDAEDITEVTDGDNVSDSDKILGFNTLEGLQITAEALKQYIMNSFSISGTTLKIGDDDE